ncbi:MAG: serine hydrolase [Clostridiaceae bacterium]|nr:serine hydrolase [Clostridiaceae bacterium]
MVKSRSRKKLRRLRTRAVYSITVIFFFCCGLELWNVISGESKFIDKSILSSKLPILKSNDEASTEALSKEQLESIAAAAKKAKEEAKKLEEEKALKLANEAKVQASLRLQAINDKIKKYLGADYSFVSIDYLDLTSGDTLKINNKVIWHTASTIKVPVVMLIMDMLKAGTLKETDTMYYNASTDYEVGTGKLQSMNKSKPFNIMLLCEYSIRYSDDIALNMLLRKVGYNTVTAKLKAKMGMQWGSKPNQASTEMMTKLLSILYKAENPYYLKEIEWLKNTDFHDRLDKYIPKALVAHKIGNYSSCVHDVGIVYAPKPYILSIYTKGLKNGPEKIAQISKMFYEER